MFEHVLPFQVQLREWQSFSFKACKQVQDLFEVDIVLI